MNRIVRQCQFSDAPWGCYKIREKTECERQSSIISVSVLLSFKPIGKLRHESCLSTTQKTSKMILNITFASYSVKSATVMDSVKLQHLSVIGHTVVTAAFVICRCRAYDLVIN